MEDGSVEIYEQICERYQHVGDDHAGNKHKGVDLLPSG